MFHSNSKELLIIGKGVAGTFDFSEGAFSKEVDNPIGIICRNDEIVFVLYEDDYIALIDLCRKARSCDRQVRTTCHSEGSPVRSGSRDASFAESPFRRAVRRSARRRNRTACPRHRSRR